MPCVVGRFGQWFVILLFMATRLPLDYSSMGAKSKGQQLDSMSLSIYSAVVAGEAL